MPTTPGAGYSVAARYRLDAVIGTGGMGTVWLAHDKLLGRAVALKEMRFPDEVDAEVRAEMAERAVAEARAAARLHHHRIVTVHDVVTDHDRPWIVMQHVAGRSLTEVVIADGTLPPPRVAYLGLWLLEALEAAHAAGLIHRDVKPSNVLIPYAGGALLTDFSIAKAAGAGPHTRSGQLTGSPGYIAPERFSTGTVGVQADLFGLGATLYFALEGRGPFDHADPITGLFTSATQPHPPAVHAGPLTDLLDRLLDKNPRTRATVAEARAMIQAYVDDSALSAPTAEAPGLVLPESDPRASTAAAPKKAVPVAKKVAKTRLAPAGERSSGDAEPAPAPENLATVLTTDLSRLPGPPARRRALTVLVGVVAIAIVVTVVAVNRRPGGAEAARTPSPGAGTAGPAIVCVPGDLRGDGTSLQSSAIQRWIDYYNTACKPYGGRVVYPQTMSPAQAVLSPLNDFAGADDPLDPEQQAAADARCGPGHHAIHLPLFFAPVAIVYNLPSLGQTELQLRPTTVARIFDGEIDTWDNEAIKADNPNVALPHTRITPVHRAEASITTQVFTGYLSAAVRVWTHGGGVMWPVPGGAAVSGSDGMADYIVAHEGAIGYVYWQFGAHKNLPTARLYNAVGEWTPLTERAAGAAISYGTYSGTGLDLQVSLDYAASRAGAYPLVKPVYEIVCDMGNNPRHLALLKAFLGYIASVTGQGVLHSLYFAPLPEELRAQVTAIIAGLG